MFESTVATSTVATSTVATARAALDGSRAQSVDHLLELLRLADSLNAAAVTLASRLVRDGAIERTTGLPAEMALRLVSRRTRWDAAEVMATADVLPTMPRLAEALTRGMVSFSQARAIVREVKRLNAPARAAVDQVVGTDAPSLADAEPEELIWRVEEEAARQRADLELRREDRAIETSFLALQARLDGGGSLYGEADAESFATIAEALDAAAARPDAELSRAHQRMDALVAVCESHLTGGSHGTRPRPRLLATVDLAELERLGVSQGARLMASVAGRPQRLTPLATEVLCCDADVQLVSFDGAQPVAVANTTSTVPTKTRTAVIARDGGCRFPGCGAPAAWSDVHPGLNQSLQHLPHHEQHGQGGGDGPRQAARTGARPQLARDEGPSSRDVRARGDGDAPARHRQTVGSLAPTGQLGPLAFGRRLPGRAVARI